jgi:uncharacterized membrane protein
MSLITQKTQLEQDLAEKDAGVLRAATALHHAATVLRCENDRFWAIPTDRLLAVLNADLALTLATFGANTQAGTAINALLDAIASPELPRRAPVEPGRTDITFDGKQFVYVAPPEPEPEVLPVP